METSHLPTWNQPGRTSASYNEELWHQQPEHQNVKRTKTLQELKLRKLGKPRSEKSRFHMLIFCVVSAGRAMVIDTGWAATCRRKIKAPSVSRIFQEIRSESFAILCRKKFGWPCVFHSSRSEIFRFFWTDVFSGIMAFNWNAKGFNGGLCWYKDYDGVFLR